MKAVSILAALVVSSHLVCAYEWSNCIDNQVCHPLMYSEPSSLEELCSVIKDAASKGRKIRAIGSGYSITDIGCTNGCMINTKNLKRILFVDKERCLIRVQAGITLRELNEQLAIQGLALSNQAAIDEISLGGAISTGAHGTGHAGTLSSFVKEIELVTADGEVHFLSLDSDPEGFCAARVGLGSLGVIYAVTLQCEPLFYLALSHEVSDIDHIIKNYRALYRDNDFFQFSWKVATGKVMIDRWNRCMQQDFSDDMIEMPVPSYKTLPFWVIDENDKDLFAESAVPIELLPDALKQIKNIAMKYIEIGANIIDVGVRFVESDEHVYLSPACGRAVAYIAVSIEFDQYPLFYREFESAMETFQGRSHWGKHNFIDYQKAQMAYGIGLQKFISVKNRLDPQGIFSNEFTERVFGC